ncbi:MAG: aquaporin [Thermoleophilaceae bacterium]|nr:aquaporin [Thermoleophilaceae bacterium]
MQARTQEVAVQERGPAAYVAELIGTFGLVFFITMVVSLYGESQNFTIIGLVHVFALFFLIQTLAVVCGAHFNPAVTAAMTALRQIRPPDAVIYVLVQLTGAVLGALLTKALLLDEGRAVDYGATIVDEARLGGVILPGMAVEAVGTFFLLFAIIGVAVNPAGARELAGLVIGATLGGLVMFIAPLTGAGLNPARSFGPALVSGEWGSFSEFILVYVLAPVIGALIAAALALFLYELPGRKAGGVGPVG